MPIPADMIAPPIVAPSAAAETPPMVAGNAPAINADKPIAVEIGSACAPSICASSHSRINSGKISIPSPLGKRERRDRA